jgi:uncharacterized membrane protein
MISLLFLASVAAIILLVVAVESDGKLQQQWANHPAGLWTWITGGNWPAKIGATLLIVGIGALLRYALINIDVPAQWKLTGGILIALALGFGSALVPMGAARRSVSLALGGAAFGVAYLTAYSSFALFNYVPSLTGLTLLAIVSVAAATYAVTRSALSLAILSMMGAYLAPAFATSDPGPAMVYGYYIAACVMTLVLVALRGWRPLIHLGFLFTLAGGAFLGWTSSYYTPQHADVMLPVLLVLSVLLAAMPLAEKRGPQGTWMHRLDTAYMIALPAVAAVLAFTLAPDRGALAVELLWLALIWVACAVAASLLRRPGALGHAVIAAILLVLATAAWFGNLPWELLGLAVSAIALTLASWKTEGNERLMNVAAGMATLFGALHILGILYVPEASQPFINGYFAERLVGAALLIYSGTLCRRKNQALDTLLLATGVVWAVIAIGTELVRFRLATLPLVLHWALLLFAVSVWIPGRKFKFADNHPGIVCSLVVLTGWWAATQASSPLGWVTAVFGVAAMLSMVVYQNTTTRTDTSGTLVPSVTAALLAGAWGWSLYGPPSPGGLYFPLLLTAVAAALALVTGHYSARPFARSMEELTASFGTGFAALLAGCTLLHIARDPWAITLELACLAGIALTTHIRNARGMPSMLGVMALVVGAVLVLQANLLRWLGPSGDLTALSIMDLRWPAVLSLLWAILACALTIWSRRIGSRMLWMAGATLLVATAVKLLLLDFGTLGQLANILAVIAAGGVFMLVGWLAPIPPARPAPEPESAPKPAAAARPDIPVGNPALEKGWSAKPVAPATEGNHGFRIALFVGAIIVLLNLVPGLVRRLSHQAQSPQPVEFVPERVVALPAPEPEPRAEAEPELPADATGAVADDVADGDVALEEIAPGVASTNSR